MNRFFSAFNFLGVALLAMLCAVQWRANRDLNYRAIDLEKTCESRATKIAEQDRALKANLEDLDDLRRRLMLSENSLKKLQDQLLEVAADRDKIAVQRDRLTKERDQLKISLDQWMAAVLARDAEIKKANEQIQKLAADRNDAVAKFNELAIRYNNIVKDLNSLRSKAATNP
jgi:chromosome segregation ATPase